MMRLERLELCRRTNHLRSHGLTHHLHHPGCVANNQQGDASEVTAPKLLDGRDCSAQVLEPSEPKPPRVCQIARKSGWGKKPKCVLNGPSRHEVLHERFRLRQEQEESNPKLHSFQVDGKGKASIRAAWRFEREQCRQHDLPKYNCSACNRSFTCKPHCGACVVIEVCKQMGWGVQSLSAAQIIEIQDCALDLMESSPVTRGEIEQPLKHVSTRIKPPNWSVREPLQLPPPQSSMVESSYAEGYVLELAQRANFANHARAWARMNMKYQLLNGMALSSDQLASHQMHSQPPWVQLKLLGTAKWDNRVATRLCYDLESSGHGEIWSVV